MSDLVTRLDDLYERLHQSEPNPQSEPTPPPTLYHYTDGNGLLGIINSQSVWASNVGFLNDPSEPGHGHTVMREAARKTIRNWDHRLIKDALEELLERQREELDPEPWSWTTHLFGIPIPQAYVFCLSESVDLLSQWERYGGQCFGYLIEFDTNTLLSEGEGAWFLLRVIYNLAEQVNTAVNVFEQICREVSEWLETHETTRSEEERVSFSFFRETILLATQFKVQAFAEEKEWRIVDFHRPLFDESPKFRLGARSLKPYKILGLPQNAIRRIITGPFVDARGRKAVELLLLSKKLDVKVESSQISYAR